MIYVKFTNGFGNNLFQYNAAKVLAEKKNTEVLAIAPTPDYYAKNCLENIGVKFTENFNPNNARQVNDDNYLQTLNGLSFGDDFVLNGYFEDYNFYYDKIDYLKSIYPKVKNTNHNDLVLHFRTGDRLFMKNEFYTKPKVQNYLNAMSQFNFNRLYIVTDMPKWGHVTAEELSNMKFHLHVPENDRVDINESVDYFNSFIDGFSQFEPIIENRSIYEDFNFIRSFKNILFEHGTLGWWASVLSEATRVGVYGPWRSWKKNNKNLSSIPLKGWFKWG
tara:strand:- start:52465 stop:53292 length:828 start_codon:yes stop_codon:yes gene_type:complete